MNWRYKIDLNAVISRLNHEKQLDDWEDDKPVPESTKEALATELEKLPVASFASEVRHAETICDVNHILDQVLYYCDRNRIWCGFPE